MYLFKLRLQIKDSFESTLQVIPQGILVIDESTKKIRYAN